ncbi:binding-protein-dependent transport system inner membrane protein [Paenibacillus montaniterrae]|uniref:Binding-protein-dependent transport system inner membrane protein n=1 Tax=Paenibacillus montaniterrae TaxID=429341 RepID=A0A920CW45_9BACL|nr:sugar ABC transporter permease [Paenibacillus montaniterrae]GIP15576.1 binding-protein-dependent transport system inner membrane protein [Paenibacillus montaniterrae]
MGMKLTGYRRKELAWLYLFVAPPVLGFLIFGLTPMLFSVYISFQRWDMITSPTWVGLDNYVELLKDEKVIKSLYNTVYLMIGIPLGMMLSLLLAILMNRSIRGISFLRTMYYLPVISPIIAVSLLWQWILNQDYGLLNQMLWNWFGIAGPNWLGDAAWVKPSLILIGLWSGIGGNMVLYLAGLQSVSSTYYEAAEIDGANGWQKFSRITLPLLTPIHFFVVVMGVIGAFQSFSQIYVLAVDGGPEYSGATVVYYIFQHAFKYFNMGFASAVAWMLGLLIFFVTLIQFKLANRWVYQD